MERTPEAWGETASGSPAGIEGFGEGSLLVGRDAAGRKSLTHRVRSGPLHGQGAAFVYGVYEPRRRPYMSRPENQMRPEISRTVEDIQQAIALLRRHL